MLNNFQVRGEESITSFIKNKWMVQAQTILSYIHIRFEVQLQEITVLEQLFTQYGYVTNRNYTSFWALCKS